MSRDRPQELTAKEIAEAVRASVPPPLLFAGDLGRILGVGPRASRAWMHKLGGAGVPLLRIGRRLAVRREDFERALAAFEMPAPRRPRTRPKIDPRYVAMLRPRPSKGRGKR